MTDIVEFPKGALESVLGYLHEEHKDWLSRGRPERHIHNNMKLLSDWLEHAEAA